MVAGKQSKCQVLTSKRLQKGLLKDGEQISNLLSYGTEITVPRGSAAA